MSHGWMSNTIGGFRISPMSRTERMRRRARRMAKSKQARTFAALVPAFAAGAITILRLRRTTKASA